MKKSLFYFLFVLPLAIGFTACGDDDDDEQGGNTSVVINDDGTTSNGSVFSAIDDKNFYLDYIKYTVEEGHLIVTGYDEKGFSGVANIVPSISYKGNFYEVLEIGGLAFRWSTILTSVSIPNSVTNIETMAFRDCKRLTSITIGNSVTRIGDYAFLNCTGLTSITIPNSVTSIETFAFSGCTGLTSITIPSSVTSIGERAFPRKLTSITVERGNNVYDSRDNCNAIIETKSNKLVIGCNKTIIPNSVTSIGDGAFSSCTGLTSITIPSSVTTIGNSAFEACTSLTSITIPNSITVIGYNAFAYCI